MKFDLSTNINNLAYILYMNRLEGTKDSNENPDISWNGSCLPTDKKEDENKLIP